MYSSLDIGGLSFTWRPYSNHLHFIRSRFWDDLGKVKTRDKWTVNTRKPIGKQLRQVIGQHKYSFRKLVCGHLLNSIPVSFWPCLSLEQLLRKREIWLNVQLHSESVTLPVCCSVLDRQHTIRFWRYLLHLEKLIIEVSVNNFLTLGKQNLSHFYV